jgi:hypothetical protein
MLIRAGAEIERKTGAIGRAGDIKVIRVFVKS